MSTLELMRPGGLRVAYDVQGSDTEPPVVLVHGLGFSRRDWAPQRAALDDAGFRTVALDLRGFGDSALAQDSYDVRDLAADITAMLAATGDETVHLVGHSLGGMVALEYAVTHPETLCSLTVASTTCHNGRRASAFARAMARLARHGFEHVAEVPALRSEVEGILAEGFPGAAPPLELFRKGLEEPDLARALAWSAIDGFSVKDRLQRIRCPVLAMHGVLDRMIPFGSGEAIRDAIPHARWLAFDDAGHSLPRTRSEAFTAALLGLLRIPCGR